MTEELKQKAKDFVSIIAGGTPKEMDYYADILAEFATEATKELQEENDRLAKHILELQADKGRLTDGLTEAKEIIRKLCDTVRALNNPNTQLTDVNGFLQNAEAFINKE